jgi:hypothetical protein
MKFGLLILGIPSAFAADPGDQCRGGGTPPACTARPFVTTDDLAWSGNGYAKPAVTKDTLVGQTLHAPANLNDGAYGNGSSWIGNTTGSWIKLDLGRNAVINGIRFGRDRTGGYDDRDPGRFTVYVATQDDYAQGNETNDDAEYVKVYDPYASKFSGVLVGPASATVPLTPVAARYVKLVVTGPGAAIDEIEVFGDRSLEMGTLSVPTGATVCRSGASAPACNARSFSSAANLAFSGNGLARPAVTKDTIANAPIHTAANLNDGFYGNGSAWIGATTGAWAKVDLGQTTEIGTLRFGRDRTGSYDDREPGQFAVYAATNDAVYATGNSADDETEYRLLYTSDASTFGGAISGPATVQVSFTPTVARFVKVVWLGGGAAIDELEVYAPASAPVPPFSSMPAGLPNVWLRLVGEKQGAVTGTGTYTGVEGAIRLWTPDPLPVNEGPGVLTVRKDVDVSSIALRRALESRERFTTWRLDRLRPGTTTQTLELTVTLTGARVVGIQMILPESPTVAAYEEVTFAYDTAQWVTGQ